MEKLGVRSLAEAVSIAERLGLDALELAAMQAGCIALLRKPFAADLLIAAVDKALVDSAID